MSTLPPEQQPAREPIREREVIVTNNGGGRNGGGPGGLIVAIIGIVVVLILGYFLIQTLGGAGDDVNIDAPTIPSEIDIDIDGAGTEG